MATVNLFLNRASKWMNVDSYLPYEGTVVLHNKQTHTTLVRVPGWIKADQVKSRILRNGESEPTTANPPWLGGRLVFVGLKPGDQVILEFPVPEWADQYTINGVKYTVTFKGSTVVDIQPRDSGSYYQLYQRDHYKADKAPRHTVKRFVPEKVIALGTY